MKTFAVVGVATLSLMLAGCKSKADKAQELSDKYALAGNAYAADCPMVQDSKGSYQKNNSPKCVEEEKHYEELHQQLLDAQRDAAK